MRVLGLYLELHGVIMTFGALEPSKIHDIVLANVLAVFTQSAPMVVIRWQSLVNELAREPGSMRRLTTHVFQNNSYCAITSAPLEICFHGS